MTIWPAGGPGWGPLIGEVFEAAAVEPLPSTHLPAELDFPRTVDGLADLARSTGGTVLDARELQWEWTVAPADLWAGIAGGVATPGQTYLAQTPAVRQRVEEEFFRRADARCAGSDELSFANRAVLVVAQPLG